MSSDPRRVHHLADLKVVEIGGRASSRFAAHLLHVMGATVTAVGRADLGGHPLVPDSAVFEAWTVSTNLARTDLTDDSLAKLVSTADLVITSGGNASRSESVLSLVQPLLHGAHVHVTPFGLTGPLREYVGTDLTVAGFAGIATFIGEPGRPPLVPPLMLTSQQAGLATAIAGLGALFAGGAGRLVDVGEFEVIAANHMTGLYSLARFVGTPPPRAGRRKPNPYPFTMLPCKDGHVCLAFLTGQQWGRLVEAMGKPEWARDPRFQDRRTMGEKHVEELDMLLSEWLVQHTRDELRDIGITHKIPIGPLREWAELPTDRQMLHREFFAPAVAGLGVPVPSALPYVVLRPGLSQGSEMCTRRRVEVKRDDSRELATGPLAGRKVVDLTWVMSGPMATQVLADLGADVIKVETRGHLDSSRRGLPLVDFGGTSGMSPQVDVMPYFNNVNRGKRSVLLDLKTPEGRQVLRRLVEQADVVAENLGAGALERLGISFEDLISWNPSLVVLRISMAGQEGPDAKMPGYAPQSTAMGGIDACIGYEGEDPIGMIAANFGDVSVALNSAVASLGALWAATRGEGGELLDVSMIESHAGMLAPLFSASAPPEHSTVGNSHRENVPHGIVQAAGDDQWLALDVRDDTEWRSLLDVLDLAERFGHLRTREERKAHEAEVWLAIAEWAGKHAAEAAVALLQAHGVAAAPVNGPDQLLVDEHCLERGVVSTVEHPYLGQLPIYGTPFVATPAIAWPHGRAPSLGEHTLEVLRELDYNNDEIEAMARAGAFEDLELMAGQGDGA